MQASPTLFDPLDGPQRRAVGPGADLEDDLDAAVLDPLSGPDGELDEGLLEQFALPFAPRLNLQPRPYQREALRNWLASNGRGVVVLPTGAGKTVVAFMALEQAPVRTLVVVPTIDLLQQWRAGLVEKAGVPEEEVGVVGGGERRPRAITVMTYDSAAMPRRDLSPYGLLIVDEVHHLPAPTYRAIASGGRPLAPGPLRHAGAHGRGTPGAGPPGGAGGLPAPPRASWPGRSHRQLPREASLRRPLAGGALPLRRS